jgi:hypothetical protein
MCIYVNGNPTVCQILVALNIFPVASVNWVSGPKPIRYIGASTTGYEVEDNDYEDETWIDQ